jgi:hypothetical protein
MQEGIPTLLTIYNEYNGNPSAEGTQTFRTHVSFSSILNRKLQQFKHLLYNETSRCR